MYIPCIGLWPMQTGIITEGDRRHGAGEDMLYFISRAALRVLVIERRAGRHDAIPRGALLVLDSEFRARRHDAIPRGALRDLAMDSKANRHDAIRRNASQV